MHLNREQQNAFIEGVRLTAKNLRPMLQCMEAVIEAGSQYRPYTLIPERVTVNGFGMDEAF